MAAFKSKSWKAVVTDSSIVSNASVVYFLAWAFAIQIVAALTCHTLVLIIGLAVLDYASIFLQKEGPETLFASIGFLQFAT